ncbi:MAG: sporulation integral membrane protein YlbJ [Sarcina sp.]
MYSIFFLLFLSILLFILLFKILKPRTNTFISILLSILILYFLLKPELIISSSISGGKIFLTSIFPAMFPFMVICNLLLYIDGVSLYSKLLGPLLCKPLSLSKSCSFPLVTSYLSGYPLGAKYSEKLYSNKEINFNEFSRIINIASNIGPLFLIASVGTTMLSNTNLGYLLLIPTYLSTLIMGLITKKTSTTKVYVLPPSSSININIGESIKKSIEDATLTILTLAGYIVIFSVIINILKDSYIITTLISLLSSLLGISRSLLESVVLGSVELTNGCKIVSESTLSIEVKLCVISFLTSFGGLSIIAQTFSFFAKHKISFKKYFLLKLLQGFIAAFIMAIICLLNKNSISTFATNSYVNHNFLMLSSILILISLIFLIFINLKKKSY